ncbi:hypothetical protein TTHERM_00035610 (macronuclear) [Tetrahymena thermophila SB210]|uniref:Uncharacterized protein n=1 Tax=Tetrahymena thermophila (strain SB210) TaxID=312017 RepID=Q22MF9_TETTS|nr:hypothetical protein TTHERM_00035610 [Tetrahymena thermophila SB210]EAR86338.2 hypothetical protein TTHERM_00035610 [Tetrahymena thermophila SB210]|eukprot:XP_977061.2 hypothetical protein TTHERM_00035610 [Tetrahymena thermophila SB210]
MSKMSFSNRFNSNQEGEEEDIEYNQMETNNYYDNQYEQQNSNQFNQVGSFKQTYALDNYNNEESDHGFESTDQFRHNNFDLFVVKKNENIKKSPLQPYQNQENYNYNKQTRSKSPSISQLPDFLKNQAERSSSYIKLGSSQQQSKQQIQNERCQKLYELGEKKRQELMQKKRDSDILKENQSQCTFRPQSFTKKSIYSAQTQSSLNIFERTNLWNEQKKLKIDSIKEADKDKDLEECTFQPQIKNSKQSHLVNMSIYPNQNGIGLKGVDKFLKRQILARRAKEELEAQKENPFCHVENKNVNKNIDQIPIQTLTKRAKIQEQVCQSQDYQNFNQAIKNLRYQLHNIEI